MSTIGINPGRTLDLDYQKSSEVVVYSGLYPYENMTEKKLKFCECKMHQKHVGLELAPEN